MENPEGLTAIQKAAETRELIKCNEYSSCYGLTLSNQDIEHLENDRFEALERTKRIEFGGGILPSLIYAFSDSPYIRKADYADTLSDLQELFYQAKNISQGIVSDEEMVGFMKKTFNTAAQGSVELLGDILDDMCTRSAHSGVSAAACCDIEDFSYINHNSDDEGFENQNEGQNDE